MLNAFDDYQHKALATAAVRQKGRAGKTWATLELASEMLELASLIVSNVCKSQFRPKGKSEEDFKLKLEDELGDALWTIAVLSAQFDIPLGKLAVQNLSKVRNKHADIASNVDGGNYHGGNKVLPVVEGDGRLHGVKEKAAQETCNINDKKRTTCKECGSKNLKRDGGCPTCVDCGWSACS